MNRDDSVEDAAFNLGLLAVYFEPLFYRCVAWDCQFDIAVFIQSLEDFSNPCAWR